MSLESSPRVTIGMPVRNGASYIRDSLDAVMRQSFGDFLVIVSDNASSDETPTIVSEYVSHDARVQLQQRARDVGVIENFNGLLDQASSEYFVWLAHDDIWEPCYLERLVTLLDKDQTAVLAFAGFDNIASDGSVVRAFPEIHTLAGNATRWRRILRTLSFPEPKGKANLVYGLARTETLRQAGGLHLHGPRGWGVDYHLVFRMAWFGHFTSTTETLFHKRLTDDRLRSSSADTAAYVRAYPQMVRELGGSRLLALAASIAARRFERSVVREAHGGSRLAVAKATARSRLRRLRARV